MDDDLALTFGCDELKEDTPMFHNGLDQLWGRLKHDFDNWNFDSYFSKATKQRQVNIWNLIGERLC